MEFRVVLDTNVFVSILKKGRLRKILTLWFDDKFDLIISEEILKEVVSVLKRPKFNFSSIEIEEFTKLIFEKALIYYPNRQISACSDPDDDKFIECALEGAADFIVSGDKHLLTLKRYREVRIISPSVFLNYYA